jgi:hypothetical protein
MTADESIFSMTNVTQGLSRFFNKECDESNAETPFCSGSLRFTICSSMIDYSNPEAPNIYRLTGMGGRGITIYKVTDTGLDLVWDSADEFEQEGCAAFPWAHNSIQDEEFAPVGGPAYNYLDPDASLRATNDEVNDPEREGCEDGGDGNPGACPLGQLVDARSLTEGPASETVVIGEACGSMYAVTASEKNSIVFVYDISDVSNPVLEKLVHLTPVSETLNQANVRLVRLTPRVFTFYRRARAQPGTQLCCFRVRDRVLHRSGSLCARRTRHLWIQSLWIRSPPSRALPVLAPPSP